MVWSDGGDVLGTMISFYGVVSYCVHNLGWFYTIGVCLLCSLDEWPSSQIGMVKCIAASYFSFSWDILWWTSMSQTGGYAVDGKTRFFRGGNNAESWIVMSLTSKLSLLNEQVRTRSTAFLTRMFIVSTGGDLCQRRVVVVFNGMQASPLLGQWLDAWKTNRY